MRTDCTSDPLPFQGLGRRRIEAEFDAGMVTSDAGGLLLREVAMRTQMMERIGASFTDGRDPARSEHSVESLVAQRIYGLALGYEDLNDHEQLRRDPLLATLVGKADPLGQDRVRDRDRGCALAGKSTLNRLEQVPAATEHDRYHRISYDPQGLDRLLIDLFLESYAHPPRQIILDLDATDDPVHGKQEGRFFHGYYGHYCFLPLYVFCGEHLLRARLRPSNIDASAGTVEELTPLVEQIWERWPKVQIVLRADSGFARDEIMDWCEGNGIDYVFGLAKNSRLVRKAARAMKQARKRHGRTGKPERVFRSFRYRTRNSWSRSRHVVAKAEYLPKGANPRFVVTTLEKVPPQALYEDIYCARGDMEDRIKEQQLDLFADRTSASVLRANQLRLYFSSFAYVLLQSLRRAGLRGTELARAQCGTIRLNLLKIGALVSISVRQVRFRMASGYPHQELFWDVLSNLQSGLGPP
ncbi:MAG: IS1380 family transposase [Candidatus Eisenbacteria bacterium]|uniref:IS1380 family transposase n=1 Tax=Eiseniibacteriota bacterium TaxID=2212470 RepID=A0A956M1P4_UNCEI|nr:IS1380 family transposase [Candidatus Eisenbacteria bacterium]